MKSLRRKIATDLGIVAPPVRTRDNPQLPSRTYAIMLFGIEVARGEAPPGTVLAIGDFLGSLPGEATREPVFGLEARWIPAGLRSQAELSGATVVDRASVITTHLAEVVTTHAARLLGRTGAGWRLTGIDPEGADLRRGGETARLDFATPVSDPKEALAELVRLAQKARSSG